MNPYDFLGRGLKFPLQIDKNTGHIAMVSYEDDIKEAIGIILNTYIGERVMREDFGCNVADYVFAPQNGELFQEIVLGLPDRLEEQEPRITDVSIIAKSEDEVNNGMLCLDVTYTVRSTNHRQNHVYPFYMDEGNQEENII